MAVQLKFFIIPIRELEAVEAEVNRFLRSVRVVQLQREFVPQGENSFWSLAVEYLGDGTSGPRRRNRIDYKEVLSPEAFGIFAMLREWRKAKAAQEAVPVYTIFTNEQLAKIAEKRTTTKAGLQAIDGIGEARVKKYGNEVAKIVADRCRLSEDRK